MRREQVELGAYDLRVAIGHPGLVACDQSRHPVRRRGGDLLELDAAQTDQMQVETTVGQALEVLDPTECPDAVKRR